MNAGNTVRALPWIVPMVAMTVAATAGAQSSPHLVHTATPMRTVTLDLATGAITRGPRVEERSGTVVVDFDNLDVAGYFGVDTGGGSFEWIDAGTKGFAGNASDLMSKIVFSYCTFVQDQASGGPGGSTLLGFYEGYQTGGPAPTTSVALVNLSGLPGRNVPGLAYGTASPACYFVEVNFADSIAFADGPIGYSWRFMDFDLTGVRSGTGPVLACVQSCSGAGPDGQGMDAFIERYSSTGTYLSTYTTPSIGISMSIAEVADVEATATTWNSQGINTDALSATAIAIGESWQVDIALAHGHGASGPTNVKVRSSCINGPNLLSPTGHPVEILTTGLLALTLADPHNGTATSYAPFPVPADISLVGLPWAAQGTVVGGGRVDLTTARCGVVGSIDQVGDP